MLLFTGEGLEDYWNSLDLTLNKIRKKTFNIIIHTQNLLQQKAGK